jgi:hypothetical protein
MWRYLRAHRCWFLIACVVVGVSAIAAWYACPQTPQARITWANYDRIQAGMTVDEVSEILGCEPFSHEYPEISYADYEGVDAQPKLLAWIPAHADIRYWRGVDSYIFVTTDTHSQEVIIAKQYWQYVSPLKRYARWLRGLIGM